MITHAQKQTFAEQGYLIVQGVLDVARDIDPFKEDYVRYLDTLAHIFIAKTCPNLAAFYPAQPFPDRFATLLGCSGSRVLHHLDPSLNLFLPDYRWRKDLPSAQRPELFRLMRSERLLNALEILIGAEISVSPAHHLNLKLAQRQLELAARIAAAAVQVPPDRNPMWGFHVGRTDWHSDAWYGFPDAYSSRIVNAWIPLTPSTLENGCLLVSPGSHRLSPERRIADERVIARATALPVKPGDVIFLHNNILHASADNRTDREIRWAFNLRYLPTGEPTGRPFLPGFVARSRVAPERELHDPALWSSMWCAALEFISKRGPPPNSGRTIEESKRITARWQAATHDHADWLTIDTKFGN